MEIQRSIQIANVELTVLEIHYICKNDIDVIDSLYIYILIKPNSHISLFEINIHDLLNELYIYL